METNPIVVTPETEPASILKIVEHTDGKQPSFVINGQELLENDVKEIPMLLAPILPKVGVVAIAGQSDSGKSSFLRCFAMAIVTGQRYWLGFLLNATHHSVLYLSTEDSEDSISFLLAKQNKGINPVEAFRNLRFIFDSENVLAKLDFELTRQPADVVMIDAFADLYPDEMNQSNKVRTFLNKYSDLAKKHKCLIIFLHHCGKKTELSEPSKHNLLGSQGFESKMRTVIELRKDYSDPEVRHMCLVKGNYLPSSYKEKSYALTFDEDMTFHNTGERVSLTKLVKPQKPSGEKEMIKEKVRKLQETGLSGRKISTKLKEEGFKGVGKTTVANLLKD